jgi:SAM-dependent methyltransferase
MSWDPVWEQIFSTQAWGRYPSEDLIRFVARNFYQVPDRRRVRIAEVGCGPGANLWFMAREGFSVYGIEGSSAAVEQARKRLDEECPGWDEAGGEIAVGDITRLPWPDGTFDAVIDHVAVCCNLHEVACGIYAEMARVARPGGKLFSRMFAAGMWGDGDGEHVGHRAWKPVEGPTGGRGLCRFTDESDFEELFASWQIESIELITRTLQNRTREVREWVVTGRRP